MTSVALVVLDTVRKDAFERHFEWLPGTRYENAYSTSHCTVPAHASLFSGRYASEVGIYNGSQTFDCEAPLLAESLAGAGYTTSAFSANPNISPAFAADRGFERFEGSWRLDGLERNTFDWETFVVENRNVGPLRYVRALRDVVGGEYDTRASLAEGLRRKLRGVGALGDDRPDDDGATAMLDFARETDFGSREFLFVNLMEAHSPYQPPKDYRTGPTVEIRGLDATFEGPADSPGEIERAYDDSVRYLADMYERIFAELRDAFDVILTLSDHGELLGEHGAWEHFYGIYPEQAHVPLVVWQGEQEKTTETASVSLLDAYATVMEAAGVENRARGRSLRSPPADGEHLVEYHGIDARKRSAIHNRGHEDTAFLETWLTGISYGDFYGHETFFDGFAETGESPYEDAPARLSALRETLDVRAGSPDDEVSTAVRRQLRDLGYA